MNPIKTTAIYGLGALGMLFGSKLQQAYGPENVKFVMDSARYARHKNDIYTINDEPSPSKAPTSRPSWTRSRPPSARTLS